MNSKLFYKTSHTDIKEKNHLLKIYTPYFSLEPADIRNPNISFTMILQMHRILT